MSVGAQLNGWPLMALYAACVSATSVSVGTRLSPATPMLLEGIDRVAVGCARNRRTPTIESVRRYEQMVVTLPELSVAQIIQMLAVSAGIEDERLSIP